MRLTPPYPDVPGDNELPVGFNRARIMARSGQLRGFDRTHAVWVFGFMPNSEAGLAYGVYIETDETQPGFLWVLATHAGKITDTFRGEYLHLPERFTRVLDKEAILVVGK